jgi:hypothetical protein
LVPLQTGSTAGSAPAIGWLDEQLWVVALRLEGGGGLSA